MKILRLDLLAFGPFTDVSLNLDRGSEGLHIIYGSNEAGKSSALRALVQLFFGIGGQTDDAFVHPYAKLRVGAVLCDRYSATLAVIRRKGNRNTLRDGADDVIVEEAELRRFLGGLNQDLFSQRFGIDRAALEKGGQSIGAEGNDLGGLIFGAGLGSVGGVRAVQDGLQAEMGELFKPAGHSKKINKAISSFQKTQTQLKHDQLSSAEYLQHRNCLKEAETHKDERETARLILRHEQSRLSRIRAALRLIPSRRTLLADLEACRDVVLLPADFGKRWRDAAQRCQLAEQQRQQAEHEKSVLEEQLQQLNVPEELLAEAEAIEQMQTSLGEYRKGLKDKPGLQARQTSDEHVAREILRSLGQPTDFTHVEPLRLTVAEHHRIRDLGNQHQAVEQAIAAAQAELSRVTNKQRQTHDNLKCLPELRNVDELRSAVRRGQPGVALADQIAQATARLKQAEDQSALDLGKLRLWCGSLDELERLAVPSIETVDRFDDEIAAADNNVAAIEGKIGEVDAELALLLQQMEQLQLEGDVPTEMDLESARRRRETGWQLVRRAWLDRQPTGSDVQAFIASNPPASDLASAYEASVNMTDQVADRLRREADRVAKHAQLQAACNKLRAQRDGLREQFAVAGEVLRQQREAWASLWQRLGIQPLTPREMRSWLNQQGKLVLESRALREQRRSLEQYNQRLGALAEPLRQTSQKLADAGPVDEPFAALLERSQAAVEDADRLQKQRETLQHDLATLEQNRHDTEERATAAAADRATWQAQWAQAVVRLQLGADATPVQANAVIDELDKLFQKLHDASGFAQRIAGIDRDAKNFEEKMRVLVERVAPDLIGLGAERAAEELKAKLNRARAAAAQRDNRRQSLEREEARWRAAGEAVQKATVQLNILCREARCANAEDLPEAEQRSDRRRELEKELKQTEELLLAQSGGLAVASFVAEAEKIDADAVDGELEKLDKQIADLERTVSELDQTIGGERIKLQQMEDSIGAAEAAEESQNLLAQLQTDVRHYAVLRLASAVLQESIERYRQKNQSSVIERASSLFSALTAGSFAELRIDLDEDDKPLLTGIRAGSREAIDLKAMSDGSRDQLYLALRLASVEEYLKEHEPIPFIVDDILVNFDNTRAVAALQALAELSQKTQVLFFTHHEHLVELAERHLEDRVRFVLRLGHG